MAGIIDPQSGLDTTSIEAQHVISEEVNALGRADVSFRMLAVSASNRNARFVITTRRGDFPGEMAETQIALEGPEFVRRTIRAYLQAAL